MDLDIDSGSKCADGHPIWLVAEGYGLCHEDEALWWAWRMTPPRTTSAVTKLEVYGEEAAWFRYGIIMRDGSLEDRWCEGWWDTKQEALDFIQRDMDAHRALPFDEALERSRLMPV